MLHTRRAAAARPRAARKHRNDAVEGRMVVIVVPHSNKKRGRRVACECASCSRVLFRCRGPPPPSHRRTCIFLLAWSLVTHPKPTHTTEHTATRLCRQENDAAPHAPPPTQASTPPPPNQPHRNEHHQLHQPSTHPHNPLKPTQTSHQSKKWRATRRRRGLLPVRAQVAACPSLLP